VDLDRPERPAPSGGPHILGPVPAVRDLVDRLGILRPLRIRDFALMWTGMTVSMIGDGVYLIAVAWQAYDLSDSPTLLAMVGLAWSLPQVVLLLASGVLADRMDRRHLMIAGDVVRGVSIATVGVLSLADRLTPSRLIALVVVYGAGQAIFGPAFSSIVPTIVPDDLLVEANSLAQFVRPVALTLIGPLVGGLVIEAFGTGWAFIADAATFAVSALTIALMRVRRARTGEQDRSSAWHDLTVGFRYVRQRAWLWAAMVAATVSLLVTWGPWEVLVPYVVRNDLRGSAGALGLVYGAGGLGAVAAAIAMGQLGRLPHRPITVLYLSWAIGMLMTAGFGIVTGLWQAMLVALIAETNITLLIVIWITMVQRLVPADLLGRVSSLDWLISTAGVPLSFAIVGPAAAAFGVDTTLVVSGVAGALVTIAFLFVPGARDPERDGSLQATVVA
jgi:MFS family permease